MPATVLQACAHMQVRNLILLKQHFISEAVALYLKENFRGIDTGYGSSPIKRQVEWPSLNLDFVLPSCQNV